MAITKGMVGLLGLPPLLLAISMLGGGGEKFAWLWIAGQLVAYFLVGLLTNGKKMILAASLVVGINWALLVYILYMTARVS